MVQYATCAAGCRRDRRLRHPESKFDLVLAYPQWQGSGRFENLARGAQASADVCAAYGPLARVAVTDEGEASGGINRWTAILRQFHAAKSILNERQPGRILTAGGDCSCDIAVIDYLLRRYPDLTVIWIDAHLDANTAMTSPSGNFHGMPVAMIMGAAPVELSSHLGRPLSPSSFRYVSAHVGDEGEWAFQREQGLGWLDPDQPPSGPVHIHFDLDALDPAEFPHVAYPEGKLSLEAGLSLVRAVGSSGNIVGLTITEFAPADHAAVEDGRAFLRRLCEEALAG